MDEKKLVQANFMVKSTLYNFDHWLLNGRPHYCKLEMDFGRLTKQWPKATLDFEVKRYRETHDYYEFDLRMKGNCVNGSVSLKAASMELSELEEIWESINDFSILNTVFLLILMFNY